MKLQQIAISIENAPGRLYEVTKALGNADINLRALNLVDTGLFGQLRLLVSDVAKARRILMEMHVPARIADVVAVEIEDKPGSLSQVLAYLYEGDVMVLYTYAYVSASSGKAIMIFRFSDNDQAIRILQEKGVKLLDAEAFGIIETSG
ncbi:MAG: amino acid-binding protein [Desulfobacteraceae bacterium]|nr:amino acid-binding protein [Desulfobacteraceae bacterium]